MKIICKKKAIASISKRHLYRIRKQEITRTKKKLDLFLQCNYFNNSVLNNTVLHQTDPEPNSKTSSSVFTLEKPFYFKPEQVPLTLKSNDSTEVSANYCSNDTATNLENLSQKLSRWAVRNNLSQNAFNDLLNILKSEGHNELPKDCRALF